VAQMQALGMRVQVDAIGNVVATYPAPKTCRR
jgi:hypothetical protein